jgi:hypothetical protein
MFAKIGLAEYELADPLVVDAYSEHIAGKHIAGELYATDLAPDCLRERSGQRRFADAGHIFDEHVPASEQRDDRQLHGLRLSFEGKLYGRAKLRKKGRSFTDDRER